MVEVCSENGGRCVSSPALIFSLNLIKIHGWYYPISLWLTQRKGCFFSHLHRGAIWASCGPECNLLMCDRCSSESCWKCYWSMKEKANEWCLVSQKKVRIPVGRSKTLDYLVFCVLQKAFLHWSECCHWFLQSKPHQVSRNKPEDPTPTVQLIFNKQNWIWSRVAPAVEAGKSNALLWHWQYMEK